MATKNLLLNIIEPVREGLSDPITFTKVAAEKDTLRIPRRYPFVDIANYSALKSRGYFRHATTDVSTELGGSKTTNTEGKLGFQLPNTEKLILLYKRVGVPSTGTPKQGFTIKGSKLYNIPDVEVSFEADSDFKTGEKIYEINLYDFGLFISGVDGEQGITIVVDDDVNQEFALVARMA